MQNPALQELADKAKKESEKVDEEINNKPAKNDKQVEEVEKKNNLKLTPDQQLIIDTCKSSETARDIRDNFLKMISVESVDKLDIGQTKALMNKIGISGK